SSAQALQADEATSPSTPPAAAPADQDEALKKAKIEAAMLKAQLRKLEKLDNPSSEQQAEIIQLQQQLASAEQALQAAQTSAPSTPPAAAPAGQDEALKKAKIEAAMLKAQLRKLEKLDNPSSEQQAEIIQLQQQLASAEQALQAAQASTPSTPPAAAPAGQDEALKKAKIEAAMLKAQLRKLQKLDTPSSEQQAETPQLQPPLASP